LKHDAILDGEIIAIDDTGKPNFDELQRWNGTLPLQYYVFDILWLDGLNITGQPLHKRREALRRLLPVNNNIIRYSESIDEYGIDFFEAAKKNGLEGIIAKRKDALYFPDTRTKNWCKIKAEERHEAIICGYTKNKYTERLFSSLILGVPKDGQLQFIGQAGTGFTAKLQRQIFKKMNPLFIKECPFTEVPQTGAPTMWVKPQLLCEVKYTELTKDGLMRHPSFQGLREDKGIAEFNNESK
jgi:bifunctional non-homologous end joining protein LigD